MSPAAPDTPQIPSGEWPDPDSENSTLSARHKTSGQIFLHNWLQTQAEVDTPQRCNDHAPWNNELTPGNPPVPIRRLSFPSLTPPGVSFSVGSSVASTSSNSIEIARRNLSSRIPGDFEADVSVELGDASVELGESVVFDFNDFSCVANALRNDTFSALSSYGSGDKNYDDEPLSFGNLPFLSFTHAQMDKDLRARGGYKSPAPKIESVDNDNYSDDAEVNYSDGDDSLYESSGPTPVTTFPRDTEHNGAHSTTDLALEMLSIIASLDTITINKLHRLFSIAGQGDMTVAVERLQTHAHPRNDLPSLFAGSTIQSVCTQPVESVMTEATGLLSGSPKVDSKNTTWQRVKRRVSHSFKI